MQKIQYSPSLEAKGPRQSLCDYIAPSPITLRNLPKVLFSFRWMTNNLAQAKSPLQLWKSPYTFERLAHILESLYQIEDAPEILVQMVSVSHLLVNMKRIFEISGQVVMSQSPLRKVGIFVQKVQKGLKISYLSGNKLDVAQSLEKMAQFLHSLAQLWTVLETLVRKVISRSLYGR